MESDTTDETVTAPSAAPHATPRVTVAAEAAYRVRRLIAERGLAPGDKIPSERDLALALGMSRTSVRAALAELQAIGILDISPRRGAFVSRDGAGGILTSIRGWFEANRLSLPEIVEFRRAIEPAAAAAAARHRDDADLAFLEAQLRSMTESAARNEPMAYGAADTAFHRRIATASRNRLFVVMMDSLAETLRIYREAALRLGVSMQLRALEDHRAIFDAIRRGDAEEAQQAMLRHIVDTLVDFRIIAREEIW